MATGNPLWDVHNAIWTLLEAKSYFTDEVLATNRIKFTGSKRQPEKEMTSIADRPEVMVWHARVLPKDRTASNATKVGFQWEVLVRSGEQPFDPFFDVEWAILRALMDWDDTMHALRWEGEQFVFDCELLGADASLADDDNLRGWTSTWVGTTDCWFNHATLTT